MNNKNLVRNGILSLIFLIGGCAYVQQPQACQVSTIPISSVQGSGAKSPLVGQTVTVRGIVTANWTQPHELNGFFMQSLPADDDNNDKTSEGIFVSTTGAQQDLRPGQVVYVEGVVNEVNRLTQLHQVTAITRCGDTEDLPTPIALKLPIDKVSNLKAYEGMRVVFKQNLVVNGHYHLVRHGQIDVAHERLYTPTQVVAPGEAARAHATYNNRSRIVIDDNLAPKPANINIPAPGLSATNTIRSGDRLAPVTGILSQYQQRYRLQPTSPIQIVAANERPAAPALPAPNTVRVATFNVLNYFNGRGKNKTFPTQRGAKTKTQFQLQHDKIIAALAAMNADIIGLMEIENDGFDQYSAIAELVTALAEATNQPWQFIGHQNNKIGSDVITNGLIYRADRVTPEGNAIILTDGPFEFRSRPPLIQRFKPHNTVENLVVAVNHFKSKGSCPKNAANPDANQRDGQACWNATRTRSAQQLATFIDSHPELSRYPLRALIGDFNAYAQEDPIQTLLKQGYYNRIDVFNSNAYSYVYDAQAGSLDHILVSSALAPRVVDQQVWFINADEPAALQYGYAKQQPNWYAPTPYRASDHDPIYADIQF